MTNSTDFRSILSASAARRTQVHHDATFDRPALVTPAPAPRPVCTSGDRPVSLPSSGGLSDVLYGRAA